MKTVKPRHGIILAGIPAKGAEVTDKLADEWIANGLVTLVDPDKPKAQKRTRATRAGASPATEDTRPVKREG